MVKVRVYADKVKDKKGKSHTEVVIFGNIMEQADPNLKAVKDDAKVRTLKKR